MDFDDDGRKKKMKIALAIGGGLLVIGAITACAIVLSGDGSSSTTVDPGNQAPGTGSANPITFDEYLSNAFRAKTFNGSWWSKDELQWEDANGNLITWNVETGEETLLVPAEQLEAFEGKANFKGFAPNNPELLLFSYESEGVWRHSSLSKYAVFDSSTEQLHQIIPTGADTSAKLSIAEWLPGPTGNKIVFVYKNNIYIRDDITANPAGADIVVSTDGKEVDIYNGIPDWVYEEEVLSTNKAMYYSSDGAFIAYAHFDDTNVEQFSWQVYGDYNDPANNQYPENVPIKYPKAGKDNPLLELRVYEIGSGDTAPVNPPPEVANFDFQGEHLYSAATFITNSKLSVIWMNRVQSESVVSECTMNPAGTEWDCEMVETLEEAAGWLDVFQPPSYNTNGDVYLQIQTGEALTDGTHFRHLVKNGNGVLKNYLTEGAYVVTGVSGWDDNQGVIYYTGTAKKGPAERHFYQVQETGGTETCITCSLTMPTSGEPCLYNSISMSPEFDYYIQTCLGPEVPEVVLRRTSTHEIMEVFEDNAQLIADLSEKDVPDRVYTSVTLDNGFSAKVRMILPIGYDASGSTKYSTIVDVYGGPESQDVTYRWSIGWGDYLATNYDIIYVSIDGRGTAFQSNEMMFEVYRNLGSAEIEDQIIVTKQLSTMYPYIDPDRRGIWGWSYGGYATAMTLIKDVENVFSCGISVAPPTSWYFYDTVYTERYMGTPAFTDNEVGYNDSSVLNKVEALRGKKFLLNHGTADDNVHYQNSMMFVSALEKADIQFDQRSYPDENHGIGGQSRFLYHGFDLFWGECFGYVSTIE